MIEEWKPVVNFEEYYEVSTFGNVKSFDRSVTGVNGKLYNSKGKDISVSTKSNAGYKQAHFSVKSKSYCRDVHRLVAIAFIPNPENYPIVNHIDGNKENNHVDNLEWCTYKQNSKHAFDNKLTPTGEMCSFSKLTEKEVLEIYDLAHNSDLLQPEIAKKFNIEKGTVSKIKLGTMWRRVTKHEPTLIGSGNGRKKNET